MVILKMTIIKKTSSWSRTKTAGEEQKHPAPTYSSPLRPVLILPKGSPCADTLRRARLSRPGHLCDLWFFNANASWIFSSSRGADFVEWFCVHTLCVKVGPCKNDNGTESLSRDAFRLPSCRPLNPLPRPGGPPLTAQWGPRRCLPCVYTCRQVRRGSSHRAIWIVQSNMDSFLKNINRIPIVLNVSLHLFIYFIFLN